MSLMSLMSLMLVSQNCHFIQ